MSRYIELAEKATPPPWKLNPIGSSDYEFSSIAMDDDRGWLVLSVGSQPTGYDGCDHWLEFEHEKDADLIVALRNAAPDIERLWKAASVQAGWNSARGKDDDALLAAVESLRSLFGEEQK